MHMSVILTCGTTARLYTNVPNVTILLVVFVFLLVMEVYEKKRYWVHPYIDDKLTRGSFITLFSDVQENPNLTNLQTK